MCGDCVLGYSAVKRTAAKYLIFNPSQPRDSAVGLWTNNIIISVDVRLHGAALDRVWMERR